MAVACNHKRFDCNACPWGHHCDDTFQWPRSVGPCDFNKWVVPGAGEFRTCLLPMITEKSRQMIRVHSHYDKGFLPRAGGVLDQPAVFMDAMQAIELAKPHFMEKHRG